MSMIAVIILPGKLYGSSGRSIISNIKSCVYPQIFGKVEAHPDNVSDYTITRYNNFASFQNAMILLFRYLI